MSMRPISGCSAKAASSLASPTHKTSIGYDAALFLEAAGEAACAMREELLSRFGTQAAAEVKSDKTLVTACDRASAEIAAKRLRAAFPSIPMNIEDADSVPGLSSAEVEFLIDPLDGTRPWANGSSTSTVILAAYSRKERRVLDCLISDMSLGRVWRSVAGDVHSVIQMPGDLEEHRCQVWKGPLSLQSTIFFDVFHGFSRSGREILSDAQVQKLFTSLAGRTSIMNLGSNGIHHALVASGSNFGRERVAGGITTAIGGPWDVAGVRLILGAGGAAQGFKRSDESPVGLIPVDPLSICDYDLLAYANSPETLQALSESLYRCVQA